jgi:hypothetical protein
MEQTLLSVLDHLVYVTTDVTRTMQELGNRVGVSPSPGGKHPAWGTRNALLALGPLIYLEIMGPDPELSRPGLQRPFRIDSLARPKLATWVVRSENLHNIVEAGKRAGVDLGEVQSKSRNKPDGTIIAWMMTDLLTNRENGIIPYFINWGNSMHPAIGAPQGCIIRELRAIHPEPKRIISILKALGLDLPIEYGKRFALIASIETPKGLIELD